MSDEAARRLAPYPGIVGVAVGLATLVGSLNTAFDTSLPSSIASLCVAVILEVAVVGAALLALGGVRLDQASAAEASEPRGVRAPWVLAALAAWLAVGAALVAVLFGYLALAGFLTRETVWVATILAAFFLLVRFTDALFPALLSPASPAGRAIERAVGLTAGSREQIGVLLSGGARLVFLLAGWFAIAAPFGANPDGLATHLTGAKIVFHLGKATVSPGAIVGALALFFVGLLMTRAVRGWFEHHYLPKTSLDVGLRTSVGAGLTYLGALIAVVVAFTSLGVSFSQIALFASALSVGIGFGLQAIIGNFVSGLILLAERPVQVGDWIAIGDLEGDVRRISIRATEIDMMDKSRLIVPNSDLVSKTVRNITHGGALGRIKIVLKVNDTADPTAVRDVLMSRIEANEDVLKEPAPAVYLTNVADGAMEFSVFAYVASPRVTVKVKSELLFAIVPELAGRGIDLANSAPIVNVGFRDKPIEPDAPAPSP
jgi:small-conductance mechanosensitive channel